MPPRTLAVAAAALVAAVAAPAAAQEATRTYGSPNAFIAKTVTVPAGAELVFLSGQLPDVADAAAERGTIAAYGDTETQTASTLAKIGRILAEQGLDMGDIVSMTVYLVGDPANGGRMDFAGMMRAYSRHFGTAQQPNRPSRSTVQVAGLAGAGYLVEIEVTAVRSRPN